jgi:hypothetical protein
MNEYSPFLKLKQGEITALINLLPLDRKIIIPLLELPRDDKNTIDKLISKIDKSAKSMKKNLESNFSFYIDNYEVPDDFKIYGSDNYLYLLNSFEDFDIIPVIGFDRTKTHNSIGIKYANTRSKKVALRLTYDYFDTFLAYDEDLKTMLNKLDSDVSCIILLDCNYIDDSNIEIFGKNLLVVLTNIIESNKFAKIIISGSSIPTPIGDKVKTNTNVEIKRNEIILFKEIIKKFPGMPLILGDYTVISPGYSEISVAPTLIQKVTTTKIIYSFLDSHYINRGQAIDPYGLEQYFSQAEKIIKKSFFRGRDFSWGDSYLFDRAKYKTTKITPSSIIRPEVTSHIKFMISEILKGSI